MREINLPISNTYSLTFPAKMDINNTEKVGDSLIVSLGTIVDSDKSKEVEIARLNGGKVLYATTSIEKIVERILVKYFIGPFQGHDERRVMFENDVIQSSSFSYSFKKELIKKIINQHDLLKGKQKNNINGHLKNIMIWRNAFAHGHIKYNDPKGCLIEYYSGEKKELFLTDVFWGKVEKNYVECESLLKSIDEKISSLYEEIE
ncbi:MAG: hypothetical protein QM500_21385 [Methylococcales bacterium]